MSAEKEMVYPIIYKTCSINEKIQQVTREKLEKLWNTPELQTWEIRMDEVAGCLRFWCQVRLAFEGNVKACETKASSQFNKHKRDLTRNKNPLPNNINFLYI